MATKTYSICVKNLADGSVLLDGRFVVDTSSNVVIGLYNNENVNILKLVNSCYTNCFFYSGSGFSQGYNTNVYNQNISGSVDGITINDINTFFLPLVDINGIGTANYGVDLDFVGLFYLPRGLQHKNGKGMNHVNSIGRRGSYISSHATSIEDCYDADVDIEIEEILPSSACFPKGTPIKTDQGPISIDKIIPYLHTIRGKEIVAITKTVSIDKHLICFEKDALYKNVPDKKTLVSMNHKLFYNGAMIKSKHFVDFIDGVYTVKYSGEILYNVLLEKHDKMIVNNLIAETLHEQHPLAMVAFHKKIER